MIVMNEFPKEVYIDLFDEDGLPGNFLGRLTLFQERESFNVEIDLVYRQSKKIVKHLETIYREESEKEAIDLAVSKLAMLLKERPNKL